MADEEVVDEKKVAKKAATKKAAVKKGCRGTQGCQQRSCGNQEGCA